MAEHGLPGSKRAKMSAEEPGVAEVVGLESNIDSIVMHFVYFGCSIIHANISVARQCLDETLIPLTEVQNINNQLLIKRFCDILKTDLEKVCQLLCINPPRSLNFWKVPEHNIYIFQHQQPSRLATNHQFCQISLTNLIGLLGLKVYEEESPVFSQSEHATHYPLEMFFMSKKLVHGFCVSRLQDQSLSDEEKSDIQKLQQCNESLDTPLHSALYNERIWTQRLYKGIECHNSDLKPILTMSDASGGSFASKILEPWSKCRIISTCVPFRGSPDLTIDKKVIVIGTDLEESDLSSDTTDTAPIEVSTRSKLIPVSGMNYAPEKLGELSAAMYTKAYCQFLKELKKGNTLNECLVKGLLLNKSDNEGIHCRFQMQVQSVIASRRQVVILPTQLHVKLQPLTKPAHVCTALYYDY